MKKHELPNIGETFGAKATRYGAHAHVQQRALSRLVRHLSIAELKGSVVADIGSGAGVLDPMLSKNGKHLKTLGIDISFNAVLEGKTQGRFKAGAVRGDMTALPLINDSVDAVILSSCAQWLSDPCASVMPSTRILRPGGVFAFGILLEGTLSRLHHVQMEFGIQPPVRYCTSKAYTDTVERTGLTMVYQESLTETDHYENGFEFLRARSAHGSTAHAGARLSRRELVAFARACETRAGTDEGVVAEYHYLLGIARKYRQP